MNKSKCRPRSEWAGFRVVTLTVSRGAEFPFKVIRLRPEAKSPQGYRWHCHRARCNSLASKPPEPQQPLLQLNYTRCASFRNSSSFRQPAHNRFSSSLRQFGTLTLTEAIPRTLSSACMRCLRCLMVLSVIRYSKVKTRRSGNTSTRRC